MSRVWYETERAYLSELGKEAAEAWPQLAGMLGGPSSDPSVERLLQGTAFLTARIREQLDTELPELVQTLLLQLWPNAVRPVPGLVIQQFLMHQNAGRVVRIPAGTEVQSAPVAVDASQSVPVRFRTTAPVDVVPLRIQGAAAVIEGTRTRLRLTFRALGDLAALEGLSRWRLYLHGEGTLPAEMLRFLLSRQDSARPPRLVSEDGERSAPVRVEHAALDEAVLPGWEATFEGFRLFAEYHVLPQRLLFVDLCDMESAPRLAPGILLHLDVWFDQPFPLPERVRADLFQPGCVPAVNLVDQTCQIQRPPHRDAWRLHVSSPGRPVVDILRVDSVEGVASTSRTRTIYRPWMEAAGQDAGRPWYDLRYRKAAVDDATDGIRPNTEAWLRLSPPSDPTSREVVSVAVLCSQGALVERLRAGDVQKPLRGVPAGITTSNLRAPTPPIAPPLGPTLHWELLTHLNLARQSFGSVAGLRRLIELYDLPSWQGELSRSVLQRRTAAIESVTAAPVDRMVSLASLPKPMGSASRAEARLGRAMCRGTELRVVMAMDGFGGPGEVFLFGCVLERFVAASAPCGSFTQLVLDDARGARGRMAWPARLGTQPLI
jgi:type VI secretion system protein ImpG